MTHALLNVDALKPAMVNARAFENYGAKSLKAIKIACVDGPFNGLKNTSDLKPSFPSPVGQRLTGHQPEYRM